MHPVLGLLIAYLSGSIPFAYLAGRMLKGIDLREHGSGNLGATNVYRMLGWRVALAVLLLDAAKGAVPVLLLPDLAGAGTAGTDGYNWAWPIAYGVAAIAGHVRSVFLLWKGGGKGVATAAGVFFALALTPMIATAIVWLAVVFATGYVSLASIVASLTLPLAIALIHGLESPLLVVSAIVAAFVIWTHRANIGRLRRGEENRFGKRKAEPLPASASAEPDDRMSRRTGAGQGGKPARGGPGRQAGDSGVGA